MSRTGVGVSVWVDGARLDDGCFSWNRPSADWAPQGLTADDTLSLTWGRRNTVDQPAPSSLRLTVLDDTDTAAYARLLRIGSRVEVYADAVTPSGETAPAFTDGGFEEGLNAYPITAGAAVTRSGVRVRTGAYAAEFAPGGAATSVVRFPPGPIQPPGEAPNAWDLIPITSGGQTWELEAWVYVPPGTTVSLRPVLYRGPYTAAATATAAAVASTSTSGGWTRLAGHYSPEAEGRWLGFDLIVTGGWSWAELEDALTWDTVPDSLTWADLGTVYADDVAITAPAGGVAARLLTFSGRITDLDTQWNDSEAAPATQVTAIDFLGDLANRFIGDEPWPVESAAARVTRILTLARTALETSPITATVSPVVASIPLSWMDVDRQSAGNLLADIAQSLDAVLWSATHQVSGPFVKIEAPSARPSLAELHKPDGGLIVIAPRTGGADVLDLSACDLLRDPVEFSQNVSDVATAVSVEYLVQGTDDKGNPATTSAVVTVAAPGRESAAGTRGVKVGTILTSPENATRVGDQMLARLVGLWRLDGVTVADSAFTVPDQVAARTLLTLLNGVTRGGQAVRLTDLPGWSPLGAEIPGYVEGGEYSYTAGGWELHLTVSRATGLGASAQWDQLPTSWRWDDWDPSLTWDQLRGVAAPSKG